MAYTDKVSELVQTVRMLNWEVRPKINTTPGGNAAGNPLHQALAALRNDEIRTSQLIRGMSLAETVAEQTGGRVTEQAEASTIGSRQLLSEFATAREAILSILRNLSDAQWVETLATPDGDQTSEEVVDGLIESDKRHISQIQNAAS